LNLHFWVPDPSWFSRVGGLISPPSPSAPQHHL
jgi:hypothetical protein